MIPSGWSILKVADFLERISIAVTPKEGETYREIGIRSHGKGIFHKKPTDAVKIGNKRVFQIVNNAFIVNIVFAWEQAIAKTTDDDIGFIASHRFPQFLPKNNLCNIDYLLYLFKTSKGKYLLGLASPGGAGRNKTLGQKEFEKLELILPSIMEQQKIAKILFTWDKAISATQALIDNSKQQKKALMQQLLTGKKRFAEFEEDWEEVKFEELFNLEIGGTPSRTVSDYWDEHGDSENHWLSIRDLKGKYITSTSEKISNLGISKSNVTLIPKDTIVMSFKLTIGRRAFLTMDSYTNEAICALQIKDMTRLDNNYLYQALEYVDFDKEIDQAIKGKTLNKAKLKRLKLLVPNILEQQKIASVLTNTDKEIELLEEQLADIKLEKKALMQQLLTGKRRVTVNESEAA
ncbi:MAG: restriction endonuclease subunit S [Gammaproteobacteria bacterium]|nr:restriction endonuclease subunit S [Gammaproteobacteria bacterium]MBL7003244.1 restriction endonuclease subunit S [Gammaproteobacteria bacterium]